MTKTAYVDFPLACKTVLFTFYFILELKTKTTPKKPKKTKTKTIDNR